uniref:Endoplasmic reticulum transmembrane protein n=1 Tax=Kalanchoe fedtschenkoi TaxID=63787 RepID=A0A7N0T2X3_KALFE
MWELSSDADEYLLIRWLGGLIVKGRRAETDGEVCGSGGPTCNRLFRLITGDVSLQTARESQLFLMGVVSFLLLVKIGPLRELVMKFLDQVKAGKGPATLFKTKVKLGAMSPMDRVLWRTHLLDASLMGFTLFLGFLTNRVHHCLQKLQTLRSSTGKL